MNSRFSQLEAKKRSAERRQREDEAPRLRDEVPGLTSLRFEIESGDTRYTWHIVVERAPALFHIGCAEPACREGGHDVTAGVLRELRKHSARFEGEHVCTGQVRGAECGRLLRYVATATCE